MVVVDSHVVGRANEDHGGSERIAGLCSRELEQGLPSGSGEVESGHRHVIQARLKRPGAWWKEENAEKMLALRVARANREWDSYWQGQRQGIG